MCGIYGYAHLKDEATLNQEDYAKLIKFLALSNLSRGKDSTGLACIGFDGESQLVRKVKSADKFFRSRQVLNFLDYGVSRQTKTVLGHTRWATQGKVNLVNTQPFQYGHIIGTHNGHINNYKEAFTEYNLQAFTTCDSEAIFAGLSVNDGLEKQAEFLSNLDGYLSIAYVDTREKDAIYFARKDNILSIYATADYGLIFWSSEEKVLKELNKSFNKSLVKIDIEDYQVMRITSKGIDTHDIEFDLRDDCPAYTGYLGISDSYDCDYCKKEKPSDFIMEYNGFLCDDCQDLFGMNRYY